MLNNSTVLQASCSSSNVTTEGVSVPDAIILSQGSGASTGPLVIFKNKAYYITSNASDLNASLNQAAQAINEIATQINSIATVLAAISPDPLQPQIALIAASVPTIQGFATQLQTIRGNLK